MSTHEDTYGQYLDRAVQREGSIGYELELTSQQVAQVTGYALFLVYALTIPTQIVIFLKAIQWIASRATVNAPFIYYPTDLLIVVMLLWPVLGPLLVLIWVVVARSVAFFTHAFTEGLSFFPEPKLRRVIHDNLIGYVLIPWAGMFLGYESRRERWVVENVIDSQNPLIRGLLLWGTSQISLLGLYPLGGLLFVPLFFFTNSALPIILYFAIGPFLGVAVAYLGILVVVKKENKAQVISVPFGESTPSVCHRLETGRGGDVRPDELFSLGQAVKLLPLQRKGHTHVLGMTRMGKSKALESWIMQDIEAGRGVGVIDPHGSLVENLLDRLVDVPDIANRLILIDPLDPDFVVGLNPMDRLPGATYQTHAEAFADIFSVIWADNWSTSTWLQECTYNGGWIMSETGWTMLELPRFYNNEDFQACLMEEVESVPLREWWFERFKQLSWGQQQDHTESLQTRISKLGTNQYLRPIIGQRKTTIDFQDVLEAGDKILLVNLRSTHLRHGAYQVLGAVVMTLIQLAALRRGDVGDDDHRRFNLYVDEFHSFANVSFVELLSQIAKFGLSLTLAHQNLSQLDEAVEGLQGAVMGNCANTVCFRLGDDRDAETMTQRLFTLTGKMTKEQRRRWKMMWKIPIYETDRDYYRLSEERQLYMNILMGKGEDGLGKRDFVYRGMENVAEKDTTVFVPDGTADDEQVRDMIRQSVERQGYARPKDEVQQELAQRPALIQQFIETCNDEDDEGPVLREQA